MTKEVMAITIKDGCKLVFSCFPNGLRHKDNLGTFIVGGHRYYVDSVAFPQVSFPHIYLCGWEQLKDDYVMDFEHSRDVLNCLITFLKSFCAEKGIEFILSADRIVLGGL